MFQIFYGQSLCGNTDSVTNIKHNQKLMTELYKFLSAAFTPLPKINF